jgi:hypothetical protein
MAYAFVASFVLGLMMGVFAMLHGVERPLKPVARAQRRRGPPGRANTGLPPAGTGASPARASAAPIPAGGGGMAPGYRFALNLPTAAGFATIFGMTGYLLARYSRLGPAADVAIAMAAGAAGAAGALALVAAWAIPAARSDVIDERYLLQGAFARVTAIADLGMTGTITYESEDLSHTAPAAGVDGARLEVGGDVVIDRIEDGVAYVEPWARVEARL